MEFAFVLLAPVILIAVIASSADRLQASIRSLITFFILLALSYAVGSPGHAHNPLGKATGTFLMFITSGPIMLIALCFKKKAPTKKTKDD